MDDKTLANLQRLTAQLVEPCQPDTVPDTVLIVEDDPDCRKVLSDILARAGYKSYQARNYQEAKKVALQQPAVALIDLRLPDTNGIEVGNMIKKESPETQCIVLTAYPSQDSAIAAVNLGFVGYFRKPYDITALLARVHEASGRNIDDT